MTAKYYQPITWTRDPLTLNWFKTCRGRDKIGPQPIIKKIVFTGFEAYCDSRNPATDPTDPGRDSLTYGTYKPNKDNTGHITDRQALIPHNASNTYELILNTTGMALTGRLVYGMVVRQANNITISDCLLRGPSVRPPGENAVLRLWDTSYTNFTIKDTTIAPHFPSANLDAIKGHEFTALRLHIVWCIDGFGIFTTNSSPNPTRPTNVKIKGCLVQAVAYFHGRYYSSGGTNYWNGTSYGAVSGSTIARPLDGLIDDGGDGGADGTLSGGGHNDGNHCDGFEIQGAYGYMERVGNSDDDWVGNGIWIHGNTFNIYDAAHDMADPTNSGLIVPGQAGSLANSRLGTQDSPKRKDQLPSDVPPVISTGHKQDGFWPGNGAAMAFVSVVNEYQWQGQQNRWSVVCTRNYCDNYNIAANVQKSGKATVGVALLNNYIYGHVYTFSNGTNYVFRIYTGGTIVNGVETNAAALASVRFATTWDGNPGLPSNTYADNRLGHGTGDPLVNDRFGGIVYS